MNQTSYDIDYDDVSSLEEHGYELLGNGAFASVWGRPDEDTVIKIGGDLLDDGWLAYAREIMTGKWDSPFLPVIFSLEVNDYRYVARMERLDALSGSRMTERLCLKDLAKWVNCKLWEMDPKLRYMSDESFAKVREWAVAMAKDNPEIVPAMDLIALLAKDFLIDIGPFNCLYRGNQLVLTDPLGERNIMY